MAWMVRSGGDGRSWTPATMLQNQFNRLLQDFFEDVGGAGQGAPSAAAWMPSMDIDESQDEFVITAEIPGVDPNDVEITVVDNTLTMRGEVREENEEGGGEGRRRHTRERRYGEFVRVLTLPANVDSEAVRATYRNGLLELHLPKRAEAKPRQIKVEAQQEGGATGRRETQRTPQSNARGSEASPSEDEQQSQSRGRSQAQTQARSR